MYTHVHTHTRPTHAHAKTHRLPANTKAYIAQSVELDQSAATCFNVSAHATAAAMASQPFTGSLSIKISYADGDTGSNV